MVKDPNHTHLYYWCMKLRMVKSWLDSIWQYCKGKKRQWKNYPDKSCKYISLNIQWQCEIFSGRDDAFTPEAVRWTLISHLEASIDRFGVVLKASYSKTYWKHVCSLKLSNHKWRELVAQFVSVILPKRELWHAYIFSCKSTN